MATEQKRRFSQWSGSSCRHRRQSPTRSRRGRRSACHFAQRGNPYCHAYRRFTTDRDAVARQLGIDEALAEVLPEHKADHVSGCRTSGVRSLWLAMASMTRPRWHKPDAHRHGTGTDVAMESAGVTLVKGDLRGIARAIVLSRHDVISGRTSPSLSATTRWVYRSLPGCFIRLSGCCSRRCSLGLRWQ